MDEYNIYEGAWSGPAIDQAIGRVNASGNSGALASAADLTNIQATSPTNTTGSAISSGKYFYLDGVLVQAIGSGISTGAPFTLNTNYKVVTAGGLNDLKAALDNLFQADSTYPSSLYRMVGNNKEWLNPPMIDDTEYRTIERTQGGLVVYTKYKRINFSGSGSPTSPAFIELFTETSAVQIVEITGNVFRYGYGLYTAAMPTRHGLYAVANKAYIACMSDYPANSYANVTIKYHK